MRRAFLPVLINVLFSVAAWGQINMVHVTSCGSGAFPAVACAIPATATGNLIVVAWSSTWGTIPTTSSIADNAGNVYNSAGIARAVDGTSDMVDIWYAKNSKAGATTLTITPNPSGNIGAAVIWEFSGVDTISPLDQTAVLNSQGVTTTALGSSVTTTASSEVVISTMMPAGTTNSLIAGNPFTNDLIFFGVGWAHLITSSAGTYRGQWNTTSGSYASSTVSFKAAGSGSGGTGTPSNACDLATPYGTLDAADVQSAINMSLGVSPCTANINGAGVCNVTVVQRVINASLNGTCMTGTGIPPVHSVTLNWVASTSSNLAGYNIYRGTVSGGSYTRLNSALIPGIAYTDSTVQAGQTYFYVVSAVDTSSNESAYSNQATAAVPTP
jgi:hypothetical protein